MIASLAAIIHGVVVQTTTLVGYPRYRANRGEEDYWVFCTYLESTQVGLTIPQESIGNGSHVPSYTRVRSQRWQI